MSDTLKRLRELLEERKAVYWDIDGRRQDAEAFSPEFMALSKALRQAKINVDVVENTIEKEVERLAEIRYQELRDEYNL